MAKTRASNGDFRYAGNNNVLLQDRYGILAQRSPARGIDNYLYIGLSRKSIDSNIYQRCVGGTVRWVQSVVGSIYLYLDSSLGIDDDYAKKDAEMVDLYSVSVAVRIARICVWYALRSRTGTDVSS